MPSLQAHLPRFEGIDAQVVGISVDSTYANAGWARSLGGLGFPLLSDFYPHGRVAQLYGVLRPQGSAERAMIIVDKGGIIRYIDVHQIGEPPDEEEVLDELAKLN
ncbi:MAG: redoxin domain-containing protein [Candidatus Eremiobacteraeota bacterium]|nr:redoxin domain-containing protein [Candidatus Eremiobacteraeota bacterium]MBV9646868.1 redoxin domain-containing protein [Candidatus Eremiobacteraeota bacterium]